MSAELKKLYKTALTSMNYFFLQMIFNKESGYKYLENTNNHLYKIVKCELKVFLDTLVKEKDLSKEIKILFKEEIIIGEYLDGKTLSEIEKELALGITNIFECEYAELLDFYMDLIEEIKK